MPKTLCIYHTNCADGLGAAWAVHRALGSEVEFQAASYGKQVYQPAECSPNCDIPDCPYIHVAGWSFDVKDRDIFIIDFSYPLQILRAMAAEARSVLVLDHHKTAQGDLASIRPPIAGGWKQWKENLITETPSRDVKENLAAIFDLNRSGAGIAWDYLHPTSGCRRCDGKGRLPWMPTAKRNAPLGADMYDPCPECRSTGNTSKVSRPRIIDLIEDRDLWKYKYGDETRAFHAVLASYDWTDLPTMFDHFDFWASCEQGIDPPPGFTRNNLQQQWRNTLAEGSAILRARRIAIATAVRSTRRTMRIAGHVVPVANVPAAMASEAGELLCQPKFDVDYEPVVQTQRDGIPIVIPAFSATYYDGPDRRHFSLRSPEGGADVGQIAKQMAETFNQYAANYEVSGRAAFYAQFFRKTWTGGGHVHAAGFDAPLGWEGE